MGSVAIVSLRNVGSDVCSAVARSLPSRNGNRGINSVSAIPPHYRRPPPAFRILTVAGAAMRTKGWIGCLLAIGVAVASTASYATSDTGIGTAQVPPNPSENFGASHGILLKLAQGESAAPAPTTKSPRAGDDDTGPNSGSVHRHRRLRAGQRHG